MEKSTFVITMPTEMKEGFTGLWSRFLYLRRNQKEYEIHEVTDPSSMVVAVTDAFGAGTIYLYPHEEFESAKEVRDKGVAILDFATEVADEMS